MALTKVKSDYIITLDEVKEHLNIDADFTDKDAYLMQLVKAAVGFAENFIEKDIALTTNTLVKRKFTGYIIEVGEGNVSSITSIKDGSGSDLGYSDNEVEYYDSDFKVTLNESVSSETTMTMVFVTGFTAQTCPAQIKQAVLIKVADLYDVDRSDYHFLTIGKGKAFESFLDYYVAKRTRYIPN